MKTMNFWIFISLLGVCLPHWTAAWEYYRSEQDSKVKYGIVRRIVMTNSTHIDLSHRRIQGFGDYAFLDINRENVKSLDLSHNYLDKFESSDFALPNLEILLLSHNEIASFEPSYNSYINLKYVDISSNPITKSLILDEHLVWSLPVSAIIYIGANKIFPSEPVSVSFDYEKNRPEDWQLPDNTLSRLKKNLKIKLCKTVDGLVKSVEEMKDNETLGDCMRANVISRNSVLDLSNLGLKQFERNWYKLKSNDIMRLRLYNNTIDDITPELLNDLPSKLTIIDLRRNNINIIRNNTIHNRNIEIMMLDNNNISTIEDGAFVNTNLIGLLLQRNRLDDLDFVKTLPVNLTFLELSHNFFPVIPANTFQGLKEIQLIHLAGCRIERIEPGTFENLENLHKIHLQFNHINELKPRLFAGVRRLSTIDLSFNRIKKIARDIFAGMSNTDMGELRLDHNEIDTIEVGSFSNWTIYRITLESNQITEKSVTKGVFEGSSIGNLDLSSNLISEINESFLDIPELYNLNLARNHVRSIKGGVIKNMSRLEELDLSENPLHHLENGVFHRLRTKMYAYNFKINLSRVPIEYIKAGVFAEVSDQ